MNEEYMHVNQQRWDEMVGLHEKSAFYNVASFKVAYPYFPSEALRFDTEHSYADADTVLTNKTEYGWNHSLSDIFGALLSQGLSINFFHEFPFCGWEYFSDMESGEDGWSRFKDEKKREKVPLMFSLRATKR